ncbi:VOC family protein [Metabacillus fastidiosus]|uniref:VOC family protein n=1 Tax=Metabacillus fastidiosus TaxID=1458 RepID=UPI003D2E649D
MDFHRKPNIFVSHVNIKVQDLERSLKFYEKIIGFQVLERVNNIVKLTTDGKTSLLSIEQPENVIPKQGRTTGLYHFAILLPNRSDLADIINHFIKNNIPIGSSDHLVSEALYLSDPDGNGIEIYVDRDPSKWNWNEDQVEMTVDPLNFKDILQELKEDNWKGLPEDILMGHIHLHVADLLKAEEFYCKGLGFDVVSRFGHQAIFISTGKYHHHIGLNTWQGVGAPRPLENSVGLDSFSLVLPSEEAREKVVEQLQNIGALTEEKNGIILTEDPSGNKIQLLI